MLSSLLFKTNPNKSFSKILKPKIKTESNKRKNKAFYKNLEYDQPA